MRIGIFGGTFNPPHRGHRTIIEFICGNDSLDKFLIIPSYDTPLKVQEQMIPAQHRYTMCTIAFQNIPHCEISHTEIDRKGKSFTITTIEEIRAMYSNPEIFIYIGMDNYNILEKWERVNDIMLAATFVVMTRPGIDYSVNSNISHSRIQFLEVPKVDISSTQIREKIKRNETCGEDIDPGVLQYIQQNGLYK